jgi:hypothetical protein
VQQAVNNKSRSEKEEVVKKRTKLNTYNSQRPHNSYRLTANGAKLARPVENVRHNVYTTVAAPLCQPLKKRAPNSTLIPKLEQWLSFFFVSFFYGLLLLLLL